jgi:hypothetical protein
MWTPPHSMQWAGRSQGDGCVRGELLLSGMRRPPEESGLLFASGNQFRIIFSQQKHAIALACHETGAGRAGVGPETH